MPAGAAAAAPGTIRPAHRLPQRVQQHRRGSAGRRQGPRSAARLTPYRPGAICAAAATEILSILPKFCPKQNPQSLVNRAFPGLYKGRNEIPLHPAGPTIRPGLPHRGAGRAFLCLRELPQLRPARSDRRTGCRSASSSTGAGALEDSRARDQLPGLPFRGPPGAICAAAATEILIPYYRNIDTEKPAKPCK